LIGATLCAGGSATFVVIRSTGTPTGARTACGGMCAFTTFVELVLCLFGAFADLSAEEFVGKKPSDDDQKDEKGVLDRASATRAAARKNGAKEAFHSKQG
jgi:hypothetical protein